MPDERTILIICPSFPPQNATSCRRAAAMAKYLRRDGWRVHVLARWGMKALAGSGEAPLPGDHTETPEGAQVHWLDVERQPPSGRLMQRIDLLAHMWLMPFSFAARWSRIAIARSRQLDLAPDVIWATYPGGGCLLAAQSLARRFDCPWIADFRDTPNTVAPGAPGWIKNMGLLRLRQVTRTSAAKTAVSEPLLREVSDARTRHGIVIPNGYDPEELPAADCVLPDGQVFRIVYTGSVCGTRDPNPLVRSIADVIDDGRVPPGRMQFHVYGSERRFFNAESLGREGEILHLHGKVSHAEALRVQQEATALFIMGMPGVRGVLTTKFFEYMASGRPILCYPTSIEGISPVLQSTGTGLSCESPDEVKQTLLRWFEQWQETGDIPLSRNTEEVERFSRPVQAKQLAELCLGVIGEYRQSGAAP